MYKSENSTAKFLAGISFLVIFVALGIGTIMIFGAEGSPKSILVEDESKDEIILENDELSETHIDINFEKKDDIELIGEIPLEYKKFLKDFYELLSEGKYSQAYEVSSKKIPVERLEYLYSTVDEMKIKSIESIASNEYDLEIELLEYGVNTTYKTKMFLSEDTDLVSIIESSSKIIGGWKRFENDLVAFSYPEEWKVVNNEGPNFAFEHISGNNFVTFDTLYYNEVGMYYCDLSEKKEFEYKSYDEKIIRGDTYLTAMDAVGNAESMQGEKICEADFSGSDSMTYMGVYHDSLTALTADPGIGVKAVPELRFLYSQEKYPEGAEVFEKLIESLEFKK